MVFCTPLNIRKPQVFCGFLIFLARVEVEHWWKWVNEYFIAGPYLTDPTWYDFFPKVRFKYLEEKYWTCWTVFEKYLIPEPYLMDPISCNFFTKVRFKYLEAKQRILFVGDLSNGSFFKLVLLLFKWFECFLKILQFSGSIRSWIFTFHSVYIEAPDSKWADVKIFPTNFK